MLKPITTVIRALRMYQWTKNLLVLAALVFAQELLDPEKVLLSVMAFGAFCMAASATYLFNDLMDVEKDRAHPTKKHRPLASGDLSVGAAVVLIALLFGGSIALGYAIRPLFIVSLGAYIVLTLSYTLYLKDVHLLDVMALALGFVIRAIAGAVAIDVEFSNWLVACTLFLALFLGLSKRRAEIILLEDDAKSHRTVLNQYTIAFLDQLILIVAGGAIITYTIYTCSPEVAERLGTDRLYMTLPFVVYGVFRYLHLLHHKTGGGDPSKTLVTDKPLGITVLLWAVACAGIIYLQ